MRKLWGFLFVIALLTNCEGIDCTLNNVVLCRYGFYNSSTGKAISLTDTLTITAQGTDSVLYNRGINTSSIAIPMSYWNDADTLCFAIYGEDYRYETTLCVKKENIQHYESPDCPSTMFHRLESATASGSIIDSVIIMKPTVNYQQDENIKIYFHTAD